jgi:glucose-6-phosphate dehydrogenase assembly protein OpcA
MSTGQRPGLDWHGENVSMEDVLGALNRVRYSYARSEAGEDDHPHPRNCVMTLVSVAPNSVEETRAILASTAIATHHPSLSIVVRDEPNVRAGRIDASVMAHPIDTQSNTPMPCELVVLRVQGAAGAHLAGLVDPLLVSGVPTYLWWLGTPAFGKEELTEALRIADALVIDSSRFERPHQSFLALADLALHSHRKLGLADFQWQRLTPWRESAAQFFSPQDRRPLMKGIAEVGVDYTGEGRGNRIAAALLIGWLASALDWKLVRAAAGGGGVVSAIFQSEGWRPIQVAFRSVSRSHLSQGEVSALHISGSSAGKSFTLSVQRDPQRSRRVSEAEFSGLHPTGGEDDAAMEIAQRKASQHRDVIAKNLESLHHTATGQAPGESVPRAPVVIPRERRRAETTDVLLTMIDIGDAGTLRHVQRVPAEDEAAMLLNLLTMGARDAVYTRALAAAADLMRSL